MPMVEGSRGSAAALALIALLAATAAAQAGDSVSPTDSVACRTLSSRLTLELPATLKNKREQVIELSNPNGKVFVSCDSYNSPFVSVSTESKNPTLSFYSLSAHAGAILTQDYDESLRNIIKSCLKEAAHGTLAFRDLPKIHLDCMVSTAGTDISMGQPR